MPLLPLQENIRRNFGMPQPNGYRKAMRFMRHANKFGLPIVTFVDTPGAYAGKTAEELGQVRQQQQQQRQYSGYFVQLCCCQQFLTGSCSGTGACGSTRCKFGLPADLQHCMGSLSAACCAVVLKPPARTAQHLNVMHAACAGRGHRVQPA